MKKIKCNLNTCNPTKCPYLHTPKPLAQYLGEYLFHDDHTYTNGYGEKVIGLTPTGMIEILEQALDAYQSTENVTIKIERK